MADHDLSRYRITASYILMLKVYTLRSWCIIRMASCPLALVSWTVLSSPRCTTSCSLSVSASSQEPEEAGTDGLHSYTIAYNGYIAS